MTKMNNAELLSALEKHPELKKQIERLLSISGNINEEIPLADDAEEATIEACREIGKSTLQDWAKARASQTAKQFESRIASAKKNTKKKCTGTAHSEK